MISYKYKTIFIHMRKCAGTSIIRSFNITPKQIEWHLFNDGSLSPAPYDWRLAKKLFPDFLVVSIVRNPWDRFVSGWQYLQSTKHRPIYEVLNNLPETGHDFRHLTRQQTDILYENKVPIFDKLLRFETLQSDFDEWCEIIGMPGKKLPHLNKNKDPHDPDYKRYFDDQSLKIFNKKFANDIDKLGYAY